MNELLCRISIILAAISFFSAAVIAVLQQNTIAILIISGCFALLSYICLFKN